MPRSKSLIVEVWRRSPATAGAPDPRPLCEPPLDSDYVRVARRPLVPGEALAAACDPGADEPDVPLAEIVLDALASLREGPRAR